MGNVRADVKPDYSQYLDEKRDCLIRGGRDFRLWAKSSRHLYPIRLKDEYKDKKKLIFSRLREKGLGVQVHYIPVYR